MLTWSNDTDTPSPDEWLKSAATSTDSWWPAWQRWLVEHSDPVQQQARAVTGHPAAADAPLDDAPGRYVHE